MHRLAIGSPAMRGSVRQWKAWRPVIAMGGGSGAFLASASAFRSIRRGSVPRAGSRKFSYNSNVEVRDKSVKRDSRVIIGAGGEADVCTFPYELDCRGRDFFTLSALIAQIQRPNPVGGNPSGTPTPTLPPANASLEQSELSAAYAGSA